MQKKPILIIIGIVAIAVCAFLFIRSKYLVKPQDTEVIAFLNKFNADVVAGNTDSLLHYFNTRQSSKPLLKLLNLLCNKTNASGKGSAMFNVSLTTDYSDLKIVNNELLEVRIPVIFKENNGDASPGKTSLYMTLRETSPGEFKILRIDGRVFFEDYLAFENTIHVRDTPVQLLFDKLTLTAFANAEKLKSRYDSVLYFEHINNRTYFYVAKGHFRDKRIPISQSTDNNSYKIGLVNPDLKEIIPPEYDVIHNISGTIDSLIEVEKGEKKGLFDKYGKAIIPAEYDEILPLNESGQNMAVIRKDNDYFYLKKDLTLSEKIDGFKIAEALPNIKRYADNYKLSDSTSTIIIEYNNREFNNSLVFPPSYLVGWQILPQEIEFKNPLRKTTISNDGDFEGSNSYKITFDDHKSEAGNWFENVVYSVYDDYVGGRGGLYQSKTLLFVDKRENRVYGQSFDIYHGGAEGGGYLSGECNDNQLRSIGDTLFEFRSTENPDQVLLDQTTLSEAPYYHYMHIRNGKLESLPDKRLFAFTQYVKMDDSYLQGCFMLEGKHIDHVTRPILEYIKNEIYASYKYKFKNSGWKAVFEYRFNEEDETKLHDNVDDSLTVIDKYNINFIAQKLKGMRDSPKVLAAK